MNTVSPKARILCLPKYSTLGASSRLRTLQYVQRLRDHGYAVDLAPLFANSYLLRKYSGGLPWYDLFRAYWGRFRAVRRAQKYDILWMEKELFPWVPAIIERYLVPKGPLLVVDLDDAIFHNYDLHKSKIIRALLSGKIEAVMHQSHLVLAGNAYLSARAEVAGSKRVVEVPTVVDLNRYAAGGVSREEDGQLTIGWIGSPATAHYLRVLDEVGKRLQRRYNVRFLAIGARAEQLEGSAFEAVQWSEDSEVDLLYSLDIGVMPLIDGPWERGKCGYKLIQYMACSLPVVASPVGANLKIVESGLNGFLAKGERDWEESLAMLIENRDLRQSFGEQGRQCVERTYSLGVQGPRLCSEFDALSSGR